MTKVLRHTQFKRTRLGDLATVRYRKAKPLEDGDIPVIGSSGVYSMTAVPLITFPTLIVGRKGSAGAVWMLDVPCWPGDTTFFLEWKDTPSNIRLLYYYLTALPLSGEHARTTMPSLQKTQLEDYELLLPPLSEQHAIVHVLSAIQNAQETRRREIALERELKAAIMEQLFTRGTQGEETKKVEIGWIPISWTMERLGDHVNVKGGKRLPKGEEFAGGITPHPYIRIVDFANGSVRLNALQYLLPDTHDRIKAYVINKSDVYISIAGTIGMVGTIPDCLDGANLTENAARSGAEK